MARGRHRSIWPRCAAWAALLPAGLTWPFGFVVNDDLRGAWNNIVVIGAAMRADNPDPQFVGANNANQLHGARGAVSSVDDGNLNFRRGDIVAAPLTLLSDLELRWRNQYGGFARVRAWSDLQLSQHGVPHGHVANGYQEGAPLDDSGFYRSNRFSGAELLDAFVYANFDLGENRLSARLGQQVTAWGESLLYTGINAFNPLNYAALGRPGGRLEDALLPVNRLNLNLVLRDGLNIEAFYALDWKRSNIPPCGTFGSQADVYADPSCNALTVAVPLPDKTLYRLGAYVPQSAIVEPGKGGQYGLAVRYFVETLRTEFGAYYVRFNSPNPVLSLVPSDATSRIGTSYQLQYPSGVEGMALSATTGTRHVALSTELSQFRGLPAQRNVPTLFQGSTGQGGPYAAAAQTPAGAVFPGYFEANRTQWLVGTRVDMSPAIGLGDALLTAEVAMQWATNLPGLDVERIGRNPNLGTAEFGGACAGGLNVCGTGGFATRFAWGYRLLAQFSLPRPATGLDLQPVLLWSQDVQGYAVDATLLQGRYVAGALLRAVYQQFMFAEVGRTWVRHDTPYDPLRDRSIYTVSAGVRF